MDRTYRVRHLTPADIEMTYPVIAAASRHLTLAEWTEFVRRRTTAPPPPPVAHGIVGVESTNGYVHGLLAYQVIDDGLHGRTLYCDQFVVFNFLGIERPVGALLGCVEEIGRQTDCHRIRCRIADASVSSEGDTQSLTRRLLAAGYAPEEGHFLRLSDAHAATLQRYDPRQAGHSKKE